MLTIFVSPVASALTKLKSSHCVNAVVGWQLACLINCSILRVSPYNIWIAWIAKLVVVRGDILAP